MATNPDAAVQIEVLADVDARLSRAGMATYSGMLKALRGTSQALLMLCDIYERDCKLTDSQLEVLRELRNLVNAGSAK